MTSTAASTLKANDIVTFGLIESASVNSINDFTASKLQQSEVASEKGMDDFVNTFICHLILLGSSLLAFDFTNELR